MPNAFLETNIAANSICQCYDSALSKWAQSESSVQGLALLTLSWDKNWDSHSLVNGYPSF